ncbi:hypothetical protein NCCNTM_29730 [Mycolicibacterium sp. NCC-Tsukiji]|nr:hypothetical protein NCCNTM_29730 [Mycolicibacterium sp. NCC-Tsukiji]
MSGRGRYVRRSIARAVRGRVIVDYRGLFVRLGGLAMALSGRPVSVLGVSASLLGITRRGLGVLLGHRFAGE